VVAKKRGWGLTDEPQLRLLKVDELNMEVLRINQLKTRRLMGAGEVLEHSVPL